MAVVGLTTRIDVADLLEKRVRSRCSQRQMWLPALDTHNECAALLRRALELPTLAAGSSPVPTAQASAEQAKRFTAAWSAQTAYLCAQLEHCPQLRRRLSMGITPQQISTALRVALTDLSTKDPDKTLVSMKMFDAGLKQLAIPREESTIHECSIVELLLLLSLKKLIDKELPPPHTLRMAMREYAGFVSQRDCAKYDYPKALLLKSFEHVCSLGLVTATREPRHKSMANEQLPLRLTIDPSSLYEFVSNNRDNYPLEVVRFGTQATL